MRLSASARKALLDVIGDGLERSAERLLRITHHHWTREKMSLETGARRRIEGLAVQSGENVYSARFQMPGGAVLMTLSRSAGATLAQAFLAGTGGRRRVLKDLELSAVAELCNVVVNPVANALGDAYQRDLFVSAPETALSDGGSLAERIFELPALRGAGALALADIELGCPPLRCRLRMLLFLDIAAFGAHK